MLSAVCCVITFEFLWCFNFKQDVGIFKLKLITHSYLIKKYWNIIKKPNVTIYIMFLILITGQFTLKPSMHVLFCTWIGERKQIVLWHYLLVLFKLKISMV